MFTPSFPEPVKMFPYLVEGIWQMLLRLWTVWIMSPERYVCDSVCVCKLKDLNDTNYSDLPFLPLALWHKFQGLGILPLVVKIFCINNHNMFSHTIVYLSVSLSSSYVKKKWVKKYRWVSGNLYNRIDVHLCHCIYQYFLLITE